MKKAVFGRLALIMSLGLICLGCTEPSPLFGSWADNRGNGLSLFEDNTFIVKIAGEGEAQSYEGMYSVLLNALTFTCTNVELRVVSEWDIRGNMLYLVWTDVAGKLTSLTLYKVAN
jgi:hypothetical protein